MNIANREKIIKKTPPLILSSGGLIGRSLKNCNIFILKKWTEVLSSSIYLVALATKLVFVLVTAIASSGYNINE